MSDRFKFRVWDRVHKRYWYDAQNMYDGNGPDCNSFGGLLAHPFEFIVEQCTGLKDRNGKLIFEGDRITDYGQGDTSYVWWDDTGHWSAYSPDAEEISLLDCIVIGNIHENPELLTEKEKG